MLPMTLTHGRGPDMEGHNQGTYGTMVKGTVVVQLASDQMLQESVNKLIAGLGGALIAWVVRKWYYERKERESKLNRVYKALFGVDDVDTIEGVVEIIEAHEEDIDELYNRVEEGRKKREEIARKVERIKEHIDERHNSNNFNEDHKGDD